MRPMLNHIRVETLLQASETAMTELKNAISITTQPPPQYLCAMTSAGSSADDASFEMLSVPQPTKMPHVTTIRKTPRITIDQSTARGTFLFGSAVSSPSGAAPSQPVNPWTAKIAASAKVLPVIPAVPMCVGLNGWRLKPPLPGSTSPQIASSSTTLISNAPSATIVPPERRIPSQPSSAMSGTITIGAIHQWKPVMP